MLTFFCQWKTMNLHSDVPQRGRRPGPFWLVHAGLVACGLAAGLQEFVALQRWRLKQRHHRLPDTGRR
jgi:hypothetical protein